MLKVYISENLKNKKISIATLPAIKMNYNSGILECFLEESIYSPTELKSILEALKNKKRYVLLNKDHILVFKDDDLGFSEAVKSIGLDDENDIYIKKAIPLYETFKLTSLYKNVQTDDFINEMLKDLANFKLFNIPIPKVLTELRPYQIEGFKWLKVLNKYHLGGTLADDMGLGKTLEVITLLSSLETNLPSLVIAPKSLIFNWLSEITKFNPNLKAISIYGDTNTRKGIINNIKNENIIYITNYEAILRDINLYKNINFNYVILDEAQAIKNVLTLKSKAVKTLKCENKLCLTGTPIENNLIDLWSIFDFLMPNFFPGLLDFNHLYNTNLKNLSLKITPFILRRTKKDVLNDLPDKYETILSVELSQDERKIYDAYCNEAKELLINSGGKIFELLPYLTRLRQLCLSPKLVKDVDIISAKLTMVLNICQDYIQNGHKILIFSSFVEALKLIEDMFIKNNISYFMLTGKTKASDRLKLVDEFNANKNISTFLISLKAGGTGLNLIGADTVIHLDPWWNVAAENQASDRAHRIGQIRNVEVIKLICENTVEEKVLILQNEKKDLIDNVISDDTTKLEKLSLNNLNFILS